jgi:adenine-specific DNA-methyltransferase
MPTLDWLNRAEALTSSDKVPYRVLEPVSVHGDGNADNLLIQGDNLDALKALLPFYRGRVKCVFIDPPYNTKSAFEHYDDNLEHSQWLSMMYPRLVLLRELLAEDGSIWVTIDDNEGHYLKVLMDEVFGRRCFVANVVWQHSVQGQGYQGKFTQNHNHIFCYGKSVNFVLGVFPREEHHNRAYSNPDNDPRGKWRSGDVRNGLFRPNLRYPITTPSGKIIEPPANGWRWAKETIAEKIATGEIIFSADETRIIRKIYLDAQEGRVPDSWWAGDEAGTTRQAKAELKLLFETELFDTPKPEKVMQRILQLATNPNDLVLDSFLGSGTTAAVAHKMGRRWIGIEMGEHAQTHCIPRMEKVIAGEQGGISAAVNWQGGGGFRFLRLGEPMFHADGSIHPAVRFATLASFVWMQETGQAASGPWNVPKLGEHEGRAIYLLFNGILGDRRPQSGNVLTQEVLAAIKQICPFSGEKIIYGEACRLGEKRLAAEGITFKHIPYDVKAR